MHYIIFKKHLHSVDFIFLCSLAGSKLDELDQRIVTDSLALDRPFQSVPVFGIITLLLFSISEVVLVCFPCFNSN